MATIKFCPECNNMLYPREDRQNRILMFACRNCDYNEEATQPCVYRHEIRRSGEDQLAIAVADLSADPTLPRTKHTVCPQCGHNEAVFFQSHARHADTAMTLFFVCCNKHCHHKWVDEPV